MLTNILNWALYVEGLHAQPRKITSTEASKIDNTIIIENALGLSPLMLTLAESEVTQYCLNTLVVQKSPAGRIVYGNKSGPRFGSGHGRQVADGNLLYCAPLR